MKRLLISSLLLLLSMQMVSAQYRTDRTGYEGDYFSLEGALDLFKESYTLRDFERKLNTQDRWVNNLDLDYDGRTDYIRVEHRRQGNFHAIILQAIVGRYDLQDVAVVEIEQIGQREAVLQIVGDEDLYGQEVFVEPVTGYNDSRREYRSDYGEFENVYYWPVVQDILGPRYTAYVSPYRYSYYPTWYTAWRPVTWNIFYPRIVIYSRRYHVVTRHRVVRAHNFYRPYRNYCYDVVVRTNKVRVNHGQKPINRPRVDNRGRYDNPGGRYGNSGDRYGSSRDRYGNRSISDNRGRSEVSRDRPNDRTWSDNSSVRKNSGREDTPRMNPSSRSSDIRQPSDRTNSSERRTFENSRSLPSVDKQPSRSTSPRNSTESRQPVYDRPSGRTTMPERSEPSRTRTSPVPSQSRTRTSPTPSQSRTREISPRTTPRVSQPSSRPTRTPSVSTPNRTPSKVSPRTSPTKRNVPSRSSSTTRKKNEE